MPLDSDIQDADSHLYVQFYEYEKEPYRGFDFVRIMNPGDKTSVFDQPATEAHKMRFPRHWVAYQRAKQGDLSAALGTPLGDWLADRSEDLTDGQVAELGVLGFQTCEQLAGASDSQIQRVGMGGVGLRDRARAYLTAKNRSENASEIEALKAQVAALTQMIQAPPAPAGLRKVTDDGQLDAHPRDAGHS